jgi:hypothetical protein
MRDTKQWVSKVKQVDAPELWPEVVRRSEFAEPVNDPPHKGTVGTIALVIGTLVIFAAALYGLSGLRSTPSDTSRPLSPSPATPLTRHVNLGIPITLSYPTTWYTTTTWHAQSQSRRQATPVHEVGLVLSSRLGALPGPLGDATPSPGPLPADGGYLPTDYVNVRIDAQESPLETRAADSPLPLSMNGAEVVPGALGNMHVLHAVVAGRAISVWVWSGPQALSTDLAIADAIVASIRPTNAQTDGSMFDPPVFSPAEDWYTATGPVTVESDDVPRSWASNKPFVEQSALIGSPPDQTIPAGTVTVPGQTFGQMSPDQVVLVAWFELPDMTPAPPNNPNFPDAALPLDLSSFERELGWESQPRGTPLRYRGLFRVNDQYLEVDVYFAVDHPQLALLNQAQAELDRLTVPSG